jgi:hypothetical protein
MRAINAMGRGISSVSTAGADLQWITCGQCSVRGVDWSGNRAMLVWAFTMTRSFMALCGRREGDTSLVSWQAWITCLEFDQRRERRLSGLTQVQPKGGK